MLKKKKKAHPTCQEVWRVPAAGLLFVRPHNYLGQNINVLSGNIYFPLNSPESTILLELALFPYACVLSDAGYLGSVMEFRCKKP